MVSLVIYHGRIRKKIILNKQKEHDFVKIFFQDDVPLQFLVIVLGSNMLIYSGL